MIIFDHLASKARGQQPLAFFLNTIYNYYNDMRKIFIFGDSIAFGRGVNKVDNWASKINDFFDTNYSEENMVFNLGVPSETSTDLVARFEREIKARIKSKNPEDYSIAIIATGINDSKLKYKKTQVTEVDFTKNIDEIISVAEKYVDKIIVVGPTQIQKGKITNFKNDIILQYSRLLKSICLNKRVAFIDVSETLSPSSEYYCDDGVHPNASGHRYIAEKIINGLTSLNREYINPLPILKNEIAIGESSFNKFNLKSIDSVISNDLFLGNVNKKFTVPDVVLGGPCIRNDINTGGISLNIFYQIFLPIKVASLLKRPCKIYLGLKEEMIVSPEKSKDYILMGNKIVGAIKKIALDYNVAVEVIDTSNNDIDRIIEECIQESKLHLSKEESENLYSFSDSQNKRKEHNPARILINQRIITCHSALFLKKATGYSNFLITEDFEQIKSYLYFADKDNKNRDYNLDFLAFLPLPNIFSSMTMFKADPTEKIYLSLTSREYENIWKKTSPTSKRVYSALLDLMGFKINYFSSNDKNFVSAMEYISNLFK